MLVSETRNWPCQTPSHVNITSNTDVLWLLLTLFIIEPSTQMVQLDFDTNLIRTCATK